MFVVQGCKVGYSFTGASISPDVKSFSVYSFPIRARLVNPTLSDYLAEQMRNKFTRQTSLEYLPDGGDLEFEGSIEGYDVNPISVRSDDQASQNRLTVRVKVIFTNNKDHEQDFETEFSAYADFSSEFILSDIEDDLIENIVEQIVEDVFNKSVANW
jgi:hypothetical protein